MYGKLVAWTVLVLVAIVVFLLSGQQRNSFIQPGTLSSAHAGVKECSSCHTAADENALDWLHSAISASAIEDSQLCLNCHVLGSSPLLAHSVSAEVLATKTNLVNSSDSTLMVGTAQNLGWTPEPGEPIQCKTCHQEHSGNDHLITANSASHCQSCHKQSFTSFEDGHPEFSDYPFGASTAIKFDHGSHLGKHFKDEEYAAQAPQECLSCHSANNDAGEVQTLGFDNNCASCHADGIRGAKRATASGFEFISVPGLDTATLAERNIVIGEWPNGADESLSPFLRLLLSDDTEYQNAIATLADIDLMDLRDANQEQLSAAEALAWQVKKLLADVLDGGAPFLQENLSSALQRDISDDELAALLATLPKAVIQAATNDWFPNMDAELEQLRQGLVPTVISATDVKDKGSQPGPNKAALEETVSDENLFDDDESEDDSLWGDDDSSEPEELTELSNEQWVKAGGWYRDGLTLYYRPRGHADPFVRHWLDLSAANDATAPLFAQLSGENAPGQCLNCHRLETGSEINWWASASTVNSSSGHGYNFTRFRHRPHLNLLGEEGCQSCHALESTDSSVEGATEPHSNFALMIKNQCTDCHNAEVENQNCMTCHQYHAAEVNPLLEKTLLK